jgi:hypothetical protein
MEEQRAPVDRGEPTPVFAAYRRGYDPDQVDHYVAEQSDRLELANRRADEAERKLALAVEQLREMHRRVKVLEAVERSTSTVPVSDVPVDTLGAHVQRILAEAWEGSQALRREAEQSAAETKERALAEGDRIVAAARRKATSIGEDLSRRRHAYLEKLEGERSKAVAHMGFLQEQRELAINDLRRVKAIIDSTIAEVTLDGGGIAERPVSDEAPQPRPVPAPQVVPPILHPKTPRPEATLAATMPVHRLPISERSDPPDASELVRSHRAQTAEANRGEGVIRPLPSRGRSVSASPSIFDFDAEEGKNRSR